jgi:protein-disulfide isomerase
MYPAEPPQGASATRRSGRLARNGTMVTMFRSLSLSTAAALLFALAGSGQNAKKSALDKPTLEKYLRHLWVMDSRVDVKISDPKPSTQLPGFLDVTVHVSMGNQGQDMALLVSKDGSKVMQGSIWDINFNPFKKDLDTLKTQFEPSMGTPGATVVLVEFSDFQCPYCKEEALMLRRNLLSAYPTQVRLYFKTFPLESIHPWAKPAAIAARCAYRQEPAAFWEFHDWVFENQASIMPENLKDKVMEWSKARKDIDALQLGQCMDSKATEEEVNANIAQGKELGVDRTPTLYVNGRKIDRTLDWNSLKSIIDYELEYQKTAKNAGEDCGCDTSLNLPGLPANRAPAITPSTPSKKK